MFLKIICQMHKKILLIKNLHDVNVWLTKPKPTTKKHHAFISAGFDKSHILK